MSREAQAADLDRRAAVHDDLETGGAGAFGRRLVDDAELHPDGSRPDGDGLVDVRPRGVRAAEDVDDVDLRAVREGGQPRLAALAEDVLPGRVRIDRDDAVAAGLQEARDAVAVAVGTGRAADDGPREAGRQEVADRVVDRGADGAEDSPRSAGGVAAPAAGERAPGGGGGDVAAGRLLPRAALLGGGAALAEGGAGLPQRLAGEEGRAAERVVVVRQHEGRGRRGGRLGLGLGDGRDLGAQALEEGRVARISRCARPGGGKFATCGFRRRARSRARGVRACQAPRAGRVR
jgi:hypothetical protein